MWTSAGNDEQVSASASARVRSVSASVEVIKNLGRTGMAGCICAGFPISLPLILNDILIEVRLQLCARWCLLQSKSLLFFSYLKLRCYAFIFFCSHCSAVVANKSVYFDENFPKLRFIINPNYSKPLKTKEAEFCFCDAAFYWFFSVFHHIK